MGLHRHLLPTRSSSSLWRVTAGILLLAILPNRVSPSALELDFESSHLVPFGLVEREVQVHDDLAEPRVLNPHYRSIHSAAIRQQRLDQLERVRRRTRPTSRELADRVLVDGFSCMKGKKLRVLPDGPP